MERVSQEQVAGLEWLVEQTKEAAWSKRRMVEFVLRSVEVLPDVLAQQRKDRERIAALEAENAILKADMLRTFPDYDDASGIIKRAAALLREKEAAEGTNNGKTG